MPNVLRNLRLDTAELLSVVDKGASGDSEHRPAIVLIKRKKKETGAMSKLKGLIEKLFGAKGVIKMDMPTPGELLEQALDGVPEEKQQLIMAAIAAMAAGAGAMPPARAEEPKAADDADEEPKETEMPKAMKEEEMAKLLKSADKRTRALVEPVIKQMAETIEKQAEESTTLRKSLDETRKVLDGEVDKRKTIEYETEAKGYKYAPGSTAEIAKMLRHADEKMDKESAASFRKLLKVSSESVQRSGIFGEIGSARAHNTDSAYAKIEAMAKKMVEDGKAPSRETAIRKVLKADPELKRQYAQERDAD